ncbi:hypothetical protein ABZ532_21855 [Streptomyces sp. NPDC019396]|uniref:hypothetical protein n=1 Tax=Streptomyces sp. NPDC019396 TaxID=3154687 RepID=UPI0033C7B9AA
MDIERIADELYRLRPSEFVAARDTYVAEAREAKATATAKAIAAMRRPTLAAWAANLLARERHEEAARFLALGETLREAHRTLDARQLRAASGQRHKLVTTLARKAAVLARDAGQPVSDTVLHEVEQILQTALARPDVAAQWAKGRLVTVPDAAVDFDIITPAAVPSRPAPAEPAPHRKMQKHDEQRNRHELERARGQVQDAADEAHRRERELGEAQDAQRKSDENAQRAAERVRRLEHELREAQRARAETAAVAEEAGAAVTTARRTLRDARQAAEAASRTLAHLEQQE